MDHRTKRIVVKEADVDVGVVPLVRWLNGFEGVTTLYCCQGRTSASYSSYVMFTCMGVEAHWSLMQIMEKFGRFAESKDARVEVNFFPEGN